MVTAARVFRNFPSSALEGSLTARFESVVAEFGDRLAMTDGERAWTFLELNSIANGIAMSLLSNNEAIGEPVVLLCESGPLLVAAILAVLKVGRFYIPLDPTQPIGRLRTMMSHIPHATLLCEEGLRALAGQVLEDENAILSISHLLHAERNPDVAVVPSAPCYVLFTSGSTGSPKPILQTHRNVLFDIRRLTNDFAITPQDRFALLYNPGFSASVGPIFGALLNGASLHIYPRLHERLTDLAPWLVSEAISICDISLMAFREITRTGVHGFPQMRAVGLGGEQVHRQDFDRFRRCFPAHCILQNGYGTTETRTICQFLLNHDTVFEGCVVPIGWPVEGKTVLLRDADDRYVATGEAGEIVVRSAYLSPGYWNKPELTRQAFCEESGGELLYRTGDLGRWLPDGSLVHLGRRDAQVKIRGHRVEVAEVVAAFAGMQGIQEVAVLPEPTTNGELQLTAYLLLAPPQAMPSTGSIRKHLSSCLPSYMMPSHFVTLDQFPRLANGKLDILQLQDHRGESIRPGSVFVAPRDSLEVAIARIVEEVFEVSSPGVEDDFFDLGCDSLQAVNFLVRLEEQLAYTLPAGVLFREPNISGVANAIRERLTGSGNGCTVPVNPLGSRVPLFCLPNISGEVKNWSPLSRHLGPEHPVFTLRAQGLDGTMPPHRNLAEMAAYFAAAIWDAEPERPVSLLGYSAGGLIAQECARQLIAEGKAVHRLILIDALDVGSHKRLWQLLRRVNERLGRMKRDWQEPSLRDKSLSRPSPAKSTPAKRAVEQAMREAIHRHRPRPFPGSAVYIQPKNSGLLVPQARWKGWRKLVARGIEVCTVPGDHKTMIDAEHAEHLARELRSHLR